MKYAKILRYIGLSATGVALAGCAEGNQPVAQSPSSPSPGPAAPAAPEPEAEPLKALSGPRSAASLVIPQGITSFGAAYSGGRLYMLGGYFGTPHRYSKEGQSGAFRSVAWPIKPGAQPDWKTHAGVESAQGLALINYRGTIYRIGGQNIRNAMGEKADMHSLTTFARHDAAADKWEDLAPLPKGRSSIDATVVGSHLYVVGGWTLAGSSKTGEFRKKSLRIDLNHPEKGWESFDQPFERRALAVVGLAGKVYAIGGLDSSRHISKTVDIYDPATGKWSKGPEFPQDAMGISARSTGKAIYASGREGGLFELTPDGSAWKRVKTLTIPRFFHQLVPVAPDELLVVGGISGMHTHGRTRPVETVRLSQPQGQARVSIWEIPNDLPGKNRQGVFLHNGSLYLFGGNKSLGQHDFGPEFFQNAAGKLQLETFKWKKIAAYPQRRQTIQTWVQGGKNASLGFALGGFGHDGKVAKTQREAYSYDFKADAWKEDKRAFRVARSQFGLTEYEGKYWVFGGLNYDPKRPKKKRFNHLLGVLSAPVDGKARAFRKTRYKLTEPRRAFGGARVGEYYYLVGGMRGGFKLVDSCERFHFPSGKWSKISCPQAPRLSPQLVSMGGKLYLGGGSKKSGPRKLENSHSVEVYDPNTDKWSVLVEKLPFNTKHMRMFAYKGKLLIYSAHQKADRVRVVLVEPNGSK